MESRLAELVAVMDRLRNECPWDQQQTHRSLAKYLLEETYEVLEAIDVFDRTGEYGPLQEELGDLLMQVYFHARIAAEAGGAGFDIEDVAGGIVDKLTYRHPHVFAGLEVADAAEVEANWKALKAAEKKRETPLEGIPVALPALAYADKVLGRLGADASDVLAAAAGDGSDAGVEVGDGLLALVARARANGVDPEQALRDAVRRFVDDSG